MILYNVDIILESTLNGDSNIVNSSIARWVCLGDIVLLGD